MVEKQSKAFHTFLWHFFPSLKQDFILYRSSKVSSRPDCIFEIHQLWQSRFSRVYSNCCCICSFELEMIKISQSSHKMYSNNILNFQESTPILNACTKVWKLIYMYIYIVSLLVKGKHKSTALGDGKFLTNAIIKPNESHVVAIPLYTIVRSMMVRMI